MTYLLLSGSPHPASANSRLLRACAALQPGAGTLATDYLPQLPVFQPALDHAPWPEPVLRWRTDVAAADTVLVSTPAYLHNLPGVLKNALDWLASSGELTGKRTLAMTFTPAPPRGERVMQSLLWSLQALGANVVSSADLYQQEALWDEAGGLLDCPVREMLTMGLEMIQS